MFIEIREPLVDENFYNLPAAKKIIEDLADESQHHTVVVYVNDASMIPTAISFSFSKRHNVDCKAVIGNFAGNHLVFSHLLNGAYNSVQMEGI